MIPPQLVSPTVTHALILASPSLLRGAALIAPAAVGFSQSRTCFMWFRRRNHYRRQCHAAQERYFGVSDELKQEKQQNDGEHPAEKWQREFKNKVEEMRAMQKQARSELVRKWLAMDPYEVLFGKSEKMLKGVNVKDWEWGEFWHKQKGEKFWSDDAARQNATEVKKEPMPEHLEMEYDPISNRMRMVTKSEKIVSHYGQELDTANDIPVKPPPKPKPTQEMKASPLVSDIQAELRQYKEKRLPNSVSVDITAESGIKPVVKGTKVEDGLKTSFSVASSADRAKLEESFARIQKELVESWNQISIPAQLRALHKLSTEVRNLGDTILKISNSVESSSAVESAKESKSATEAGSKVQARTLKELSNQVKDLGQRLANISNKVDPNTSKSADFFPMVFGGKTPFKETKQLVEKNDQLMQEEVNNMKQAMIRAEESEKVFGDPRMNDSELQEEMQNIYEKEYGEITPAHEQVSSAPTKASPPSQSTQVPEVTQTPPLQNVDIEKQTEISTQPEAATPLQQDTIYTVLAYDPSTSEVSTTTLLAPVPAEETTMPLTVALTQLSEPAKFLPHLRLMRENNFRAVSVTKNLLVLRGTPPTPSTITTTTTAKESMEKIPEPKSTQTAQPQSTTPQSPENDRPAKRLEPFYTGSKQERHHYRRHGDRGFFKDLLSFTIKYAMITGALIYLLGLKDGMKKVPVPKQSGEELEQWKRSS